MKSGMRTNELTLRRVDASKPTARIALSRRMVLSRLANLEEGQLIIVDGSERISVGRPSDDFPLGIEVHVVDPRFYSDVLFGGAVGAGEAFMQGHWECNKLVEMLRILIRNRDVLAQVDSGLALLSAPLRMLLNAFNKNTRRGSRKNIAAHYDVGNDFYQLWLDPSMMYSCAYFDYEGTPLEHAATEKLDRICRKLDLNSGDSVIEIGTGWGGFALHAAKHYGCHVTTTTISQRQYDFARQAIADAELQDQITLLLQDYRDLEGKFDKLVSIEMIEAVGHEYHDTFFKQCCDLLKPEGQMLLQAITIADQHYDRYKTSVDFIKKYIFPGGCLTSVTDMTQTMTKHTDMRVIHLEDIGPHYATTLRLWLERFSSRLEEIRQLGYSESFLRMWRFYLQYCESAFIERSIGDVQMLIIRPAARREWIQY